MIEPTQGSETAPSAASEVKPNGGAAGISFQHYSRVTLPSRALPPVKFTIYKISLERRTRVDQELAEPRERYRKLATELQSLPLPESKALSQDARELTDVLAELLPLIEHADIGDPGRVLTARAWELVRQARTRPRTEPPPEDPAVSERRYNILASIGQIYDKHFKPAFLRVFVHSVEGLEIDDKPATVETLLSDGPAELVDEIFEILDRGAYLTERERGESSRPTISSEPAAGVGQSSTVTSASGSATGGTETA